MIKRKAHSDVDGTLAARILYYDFFASLFLYDLLLCRENLLKNQISILKQYPLSDSNIVDFELLHKELDANGIKNFIFEHTYLFMLPFTSHIDVNTTFNEKRKNNSNRTINKKSVVLYLSYYIDGSIAGNGLTIAKQLVKQSKVRINDVNFKENEEHFGFLLLFMKYLLQNNNMDLSIKVFKECIKPMQYKIIEGLNDMGDGYLYFHISRLLDIFMDVELGIMG